MAQQRKIGQSKVSRRELERIEARKEKDKANFSTIVMRVFIVILLVAMLLGLAVQILVY